MTDPASIFTPAAAAPATVSFTVDDALAIANALGAAAAALPLAPAVAGTIALATGIASLLRTTVLPAIRNLQDRNISVVEQAILAADDAVERLRVGAPPATIR